MMRMAMEGAEKVNNELEIGFDELFERRWHRAELAGRGVMVLIVAAALAGLLGQGPFSHSTRVDPSGRLAVDWEPVARFGTSTQMTIHLHDVHPGAETVHLGGSFGEPLGLAQVLPVPLKQIARADGFDLVFAIPDDAGDAMMRLALKPSSIGPIPMRVSVDGASLSLTQVVLP